MTSTPPSPPPPSSPPPRLPSSSIAAILQGGGEGECMEQGEQEIPESPAEHAAESVVDCAVAGNPIGDDERPSASGDQALEQVEISHAGEAGVDPTARDPAGTSMPTSPRRVSDLTVAVDSDSSGSSSWTAAAEGPSSPVTEPATHGSHWRSIVSGLLHMRRKSKSRSKEKAMRRLSTFPPVTAAKGERSQPRRRPEGGKEELHLEALDRWRPSWRSFSHLELATATDNFSSEKLIGRGGHAEVYKGCMPDGQLVAVKRLMKKDMEERVADFLAELGVIAHVNHPNAACLLGFGLDGGLHLVLKFSPHGSLASALHGSKEKLGWEKRFRIARGVAEGLLYLHEGCHRRIIHRDIKASNILLTEDYEPQISDFGLAKWLPERWNHHVVFPIEGTFGYMAPEYFMHGIVSEKTDAFAFGVLLLELITGRKAVDSDRQSLVIWAKPLLDAKDLEALVDPFLQGAYDLEEMGRSLLAASLCIHHLPSVRPRMKEVLNLLQGEELVVMGKDELKQPAGVPNSRPFLLATGDSEEENYTCSKYLSDLNRYKQLALEQ